MFLFSSKAQRGLPDVVWVFVIGIAVLMLLGSVLFHATAVRYERALAAHQAAREALKFVPYRLQEAPCETGSNQQTFTTLSRPHTDLFQIAMPVGFCVSALEGPTTGAGSCEVGASAQMFTFVK